MRAQSQDRITRSVRDLSCFGQAVRLDVRRRRWRCREARCSTKTWTEDVDQLDATAVLTRRAGAEACRQVGQQARPVAAVARDFGVCWWTVMNAVIEHGTPLVDSSDPAAKNRYVLRGGVPTAVPDTAAGMFTSMLLTLLIVPVFYLGLERVRTYFSARSAARLPPRMPGMA